MDFTNSADLSAITSLHEESKLDIVPKDYYLDIIHDIEVGLRNGIPLCGMSDQILSGQSFEAIRANCHPAVDDETIRTTMNFIYSSLRITYEDGEVALKGFLYPKKR